MIGELLRRRGAGGGGGCHRNAPFVFIVDKIGSARFAHNSQMSSGYAGYGGIDGDRGRY